MKKICLTVVGMYFMLLHAFSQVTKDSAAFQPRKLKLDEVNLVSSYYTQNGDHSAIGGGIGTEKVTDLANGLELKWVGWDTRGRKNTLTAGMGIDHHTAASQAYISKTGASRRTDGLRLYPSLDWTRENEKKGTSFSLGAYYSNEFNYKSIGLNAGATKKTKNNGEFGLKLSAYFDQVRLIYPSEFEPAGSYGGFSERKHPDYGSSPRQTYTASFSFSQVINTRLQATLLLDLVEQHGYLGLPFHRVYFTDGSDAVENLPSSRFKLPIGLRLNYFMGDRIILRGYYRYYTDNWGLQAHTASLEVPVKLTPFLSISPFYRYYTQTAVKYFAPYEEHLTTDKYFTSNYALSSFSSGFFGAGLRIAPPYGIFGTHLSALELRYGHYTQTTDLVSDVISLHLQFK
ncbi:MAG: hypothetical protein BGO55_26680 [Sphingobacteriales bacterium 50-39]|nr:DUF3570 domain-containing protein [Sphingobacteriales bacterium]OJW56477.1 MAG: hypothetical protein BGO55_26680 [Sphingobacteriales bacterium 50-39]